MCLPLRAQIARAKAEQAGWANTPMPPAHTWPASGAMPSFFHSKTKTQLIGLVAPKSPGNGYK